VVGGKPIANVTLEDFERVMSELTERAGRKLRPASRWQVAQCMRRVLVLAEYPAKVIARNPVPETALPKARKSELALQFVYPDEDAELLACTSVDLGRRLLVGFLTRIGWRKAEALGGQPEEVDDAAADDEGALEKVPALTWSRLDLERGLVRPDRNKTNDVTLTPLDPDLVTALRAWKELHPSPSPDSPVFVETSGAAIDPEKASPWLRSALLVAGVDRLELHAKATAFRRPLRLHDLRASMVTVALANGRPEEWIRRRTKHTSSALDRYRREAKTLAELDLGDWRPLDRVIPELAAVVAQHPDWGKPPGERRSGGSPRTAKPSESLGDRRGLNPRQLEPQSSALPTELRPP
jgi:hypothetical protein